MHYIGVLQDCLAAIRRLGRILARAQMNRGWYRCNQLKPLANTTSYWAARSLQDMHVHALAVTSGYAAFRHHRPAAMQWTGGCRTHRLSPKAR